MILFLMCRTLRRWKPTLDLKKMSLLQERWMGKRSSRYCVPCKLIAYIRSPEAISNTCVLCADTAILCFRGLYPSRYGSVRESYMLALPSFVVESRVRFVESVLAMFPDRILMYALSTSLAK